MRSRPNSSPESNKPPFWRRLLGVFLSYPLQSRIIWLVLLIAGLFLLEYFEDLKHPSKTPWFKDIANNERHTFKTFLSVGLWYGTLIHLALISLVLSTVRWWGRGRPARYAVGFADARQRGGRLFWIFLAVICIASGALRWPKMSLSYWGDEGWAVAPYVYGKHVPVNPEDPQGLLVHRPVSWLNTAFDDRTCGNHYLFSLLQRATLTAWRGIHQLPEEAFDETISRLPPLAAGIGALIALACLLRWLGRPGAGLAAATMMALHPWHLRYSTEARGYTLMLFFLIVSCWLAFIAMRHGKWRWWLAFALAQFLCMYSWKGAMYPLAAVNLILFAWLMWGRRREADNPPESTRSSAVLRWVVANLLAAGLFINLVYPCLLQVKDAKNHLIQLSGRPMGVVWLHNSISSVFTGMPWHVEEPENPTEVVLSRQLQTRPLATASELAALAALLAGGLRSLARRHPWLAAMSLAIFASSLFGAWFFRYVIDAEWISWYFLFLIFPVSLLAGVGADSLLRRAAMLWPASDSSRLSTGRQSTALAVLCAVFGLALPASYAELTFPASRLMSHQAYEDHRGAFQVTRGRHEPLHDKGPSKVWTVYLWRYITLYDPRGDTHVRRGSELRELMAEVEKKEGKLYVIVGHRRMARQVSEGIMNIVENSGLFEHVHTFWAPEELHCLHCYQYVPASKSGSPAQ